MNTTHRAYSRWYLFALGAVIFASLSLLALAETVTFTTTSTTLFILYGLDIGCMLAIGGFALLQYYARPTMPSLFVAAAFIGGVFLRICALFALQPWSTASAQYMTEVWMRWSWFASQFSIALLLFLSWWVPRIMQRYALSSRFGHAVFLISSYITVLIPLLGMIALNATDAHDQWLAFVPIWEAVPASIFALAVISFMLEDSEWAKKPFYFWMTLSALVMSFAHLFFMARSTSIHDELFLFGTLLKQSANILGLSGAAISMWHLFRLEIHNQDALVAQNIILHTTEDELHGALKETEQQKQEIEHQLSIIAAAKARDEAMLNSIGDGVVVTDDDTRVIYANPKFTELLGWTSEEIIHRPVTAVMPMLDSAGELVPYEKRAHPIALFTGQQISTSMKYYYRRKDGTAFPASITVTPIKLSDHTVGAIEIFRDVTREKEIDDEKSSFVSVASHQLRTPLTSINWYLELLLSGDAGKLKESQKQYMQEVYKGSRRLVGLVDDLLNVSRIESGKLRIKPEILSPVDIINDAIREVDPLLATSQARIRFVQPRGISEMLLDPSLFHELVHNLLTNAIRYSPHDKPSTITVRAEKIRVLKGKHAHIAQGGTHVLFSVADKGIGIPKEAQPKIFQKLFRADNALHAAPEGTGLGLYLVKMIVDQAGGTIWYETSEGKGTTFFFSFPLKGMQKKEGEKTLAQYE